MFEKQSRCRHQAQFMRCAYALTKQDRGQSLIELAIIMPVFVLIFLGLLQFGSVRYAEILMHMAARHGARVESLDGNGRAAISEYLSRHSFIDMNNVTVSIGRRLFEPVDVIDVKIAYRVQPMPIFRRVFPKDFSIQVAYVF